MVLSITNQKGGVGKTTTTINIGVYLALKGKKVLIIDADPQCNSSTFFIEQYSEQFEDSENGENETLYSTVIEEKPLNIYQTRYENIQIVPSSLALASADIELAVARGLREGRLSKQLDKVKHLYDYILIDCPPALSMLTLNAYMASDRFIIIIDTSQDSLRGIPQLSLTINEIIQGSLEHKIEFAGIVLNRYLKPDQDKPTKTTLDNLVKTGLDKHLLKSKLPKRNIVENSKVEFRTPIEVDNKNDYSIAISYLCKDLFNI